MSQTSIYFGHPAQTLKVEGPALRFSIQLGLSWSVSNLPYLGVYLHDPWIATIPILMVIYAIENMVEIIASSTYLVIEVMFINLAIESHPNTLKHHEIP